MLSFQKVGSRGPLLVLLHWLGGGASTWAEVSRRLAERGVTCVAISLPGFGGSANAAGDNVLSMADQVMDAIHSLRSSLAEPTGPWVIAGHSMGGKVAAVLARRALDGETSLRNLRGLVLVSASPPGPEPMPGQKRADLLQTLGQTSGNPRQDEARAAAFVAGNTGKLPLPPAVHDGAVTEVLRMRRTAFRAWLEHGSREDWSDRVGVLDLPALVFAGTEDAALGPEAQRTHVLPHLSQATLVELENCGHLAPLERPAELAEHLTVFLVSLTLRLSAAELRPGPSTAAVMHSEHTSPKTLAVMEHRLAGSQDWNHLPTAFTGDEFRTLRALAAAVVPGAPFDLAACLDGQLAQGTGDGWRFADLPADPTAWKQGLDSLDIAADRLHGVPFVGLYPDQQHALLQDAAAGKLGPGLLGTLHLGRAARAYTADRMQLWFGDVRAEFTRLYMGDPRTMDRIGYTGFADDLGFTQIQLGQQEEFER